MYLNASYRMRELTQIFANNTQDLC